MAKRFFIKVVSIGTIFICCFNLIIASPVEIYTTGKTAIAQDKTHLYETSLKALSQHPLGPYLKARFYEHNIENLKDLTILQTFITQYANKPFASSLQFKLWQQFFKNENWQALVQSPLPALSENNRCLQRVAYLKQQQLEMALQNFKAFWEKQNQLGTACLMIETEWLSTLSTTTLKHSFLDALTKNHLQRAQRIIQYLPPKDRVPYQQKVDLFSSLNLTTTLPFSPKGEEALLNTLLIRYAQKKSSIQAQVLLEAWTQRYALEKEKLRPAQIQLAIYQAARPDSTNALERINTIPPQLRTEELIQWGIRLSLKQENWQQVIDFITQLPAETKAHSDWQYWLGRAYQALEQPKQAQKHFLMATKNIDFYAFLAADQLNQPYQTLQQALNSQISSQTLHNPNLEEAFWLLNAQETLWGKQLWQQALKPLSAKERLSAAIQAQQRQFHDLSIRAAASLSQKDSLKLRYPIAYDDIITPTLKDYDNHLLSTPLILGLIRQESLFQTDARSPADAYGLMQLLIPTADRMAARLNEKRQSLYQPTYNIRYGIAYLDFLATEQIGVFIPAILAGYNAGPKRANEWQNSQLAADIWIETIPYKETRHYVKQVLTNAVIYSYLLKNHDKLSDYLIQ